LPALSTDLLLALHRAIAMHADPRHLEPRGSPAGQGPRAEEAPCVAPRRQR
jgi:hypothetical protein